MNAEIKNALAKFSNALDDLEGAHKELLTVRDTANEQAFDAELNRIEWVMSQVHHAQTALMKVAMLSKTARKAANADMPKIAETITISALHGGTALLAASAYSARAFVYSVKNPTAKPLWQDAALAANWAGVGAMLGMISRSMH